VELNSRKKLIRITTVPMSLKFLLPGQMKFMQQNEFDVIMISAAGPEINDVVANEGCQHITVPMTRKITPVKDLACLWQLIKIFKKEKPDIVHTHTPKAGLLGMLAANLSGVKIRIHTVAGLPLMVETGFKFQLLKVIEKITYLSANQLWPNSFSLLKYINEQKLTKESKLKVISKGSSNGINLNRFSIANFNKNILSDVKKSIDYKEKEQYLLCIGRLVKDKGIIELVETFKKLENAHHYTKLVLVGKYETELDPLPASILEEIETNKNIIHIDWTPYVEYYISLATLFVFPSHREGFPNVLLQSGAIGTAIICSSIAGNVDLVENNVTGLLFTVGDKIQMENQITFALNNIGAMKNMAATLKSNIFKYYDREIVWNAILQEYKTLLG
jgi:glycosyltransferase involved in cell wall biosynthesis